MIEQYKKTNLFIIEEGLWAWAKYRADLQGYKSVSEYIFKLIEEDKKRAADQF